MILSYAFAYFYFETVHASNLMRSIDIIRRAELFDLPGDGREGLKFFFPLYLSPYLLYDSPRRRQVGVCLEFVYIYW